MRKFLYSFVIVIVTILILTFSVIFFLFYSYGTGLPDYQHLANYKPPIVTRLYANDGHLFAEYAHEKRIYVPLQAVPKKVIQAFLAAEDKNFYHHGGIDILHIASAFLTNFKRISQSKRPIGASTITQQVARNFLLTDIAQSVSYSRKIKEAILAFRLEKAYSKDYILELFLNEIYLGSGSYGIAAAALNYFNKGLDELTIAEIAYLAGLPKAPSHYHPARNPQGAKIRRDYVLRRLYEDGYITSEEATKAVSEPIILHERILKDVAHGSYFAEEVRKELIEKFGETSLYEGGLVVRTSLDPSFQKYARDSLREGLIHYDRRHGWRGPILHISLTSEETNSSSEQGKMSWISKIKSVVSPSGKGNWRLAIVLEMTAKGAVIGFSEGITGQIPLKEMQWARKYINEYAQGPAVSHPKDVLTKGDVILVDSLKGTTKNEFTLCQIPAVSGAILVMNPHNGQILAMHGGFSFKISQFNRATQAMRQMGSAFKPFVYLTALQKGMTPSTRLYDGPFSLDMGYGRGIWRPHNYEENYLGWITLRRAVELSCNLVTVRLAHEYLGMKSIKNTAELLGLVNNFPLHLATVLGASESTLLKVTTAYAMIANGGKRITPTLLDRVQDRHGKNLYVNEEKSCEGCGNAYWMNSPPVLKDHRPLIIDPRIAYQMTSLLHGCTQRGTARSLADIDYPLAGKTGTTNVFKDAWFIGYTPDLVVGVFVGFDTPREMGAHESGGRLALPIFKAFITQALKNTPAIPFRIPAGIKHVRVNALTGIPAGKGEKNVILEAYLSDTQESPTEYFPETLPLRNQDLDMPLEKPLPHFPDPAFPSSSLEGTGGLY